jgi:hypothetical protein
VTDGNTDPTPERRADPVADSVADQPGAPDVARLLDDLRVLLQFVTVHQARVLAQQSQTPNPHTIIGNDGVVLAAPVRFGPAVHLALLAKTPAEIGSDANLLEQLYGCLAVLSDAAAPASVGSIHLTSAFTRIPFGPRASPAVGALARKLARWFTTLAALGFAAFILAVMLLIHTDHGRRSIQQLEAVKQEYQQTLSMIGDVTAAQPTAHGEASCANAGALAADARADARLQALCTQLSDLTRRRSIINQELRDWNTVSYRLAYFTSIRWLAGREKLPADVSKQDWQSADSRTEEMMAGLTGVILPMLLGLLGAGAYVFRDLDRQLRTWTLHRGSAAHGALLLLLGLMLGGFLGVYWNKSAPQVEGVALTLAALAFFVGFGIEIVFQTLDIVITRLANRIASVPNSTGK